MARETKDQQDIRVLREALYFYAGKTLGGDRAAAEQLLARAEQLVMGDDYAITAAEEPK